jgi:4-amino-4-deoxy-L-arabinose transferase-like glycosyltransferase
MSGWTQLWFLILGLKLILSYFFPLSADECYYWVWSKHLSLSYFDHPPMISYLIWIGNVFDGLGGYALRWPAVLMGHLTLWVWDLVFKKHMNPKQRGMAWFLYLSHPITGLGSIILTPDLPLMFFFSLSFFFGVKTLANPNWLNYLFLGVSLGLGFLSKYHIVLTLPMLLILVYEKKAWSWIFSKKLFITILGGFLLSLPVFIWNYQNDWVSFLFQLNHGFGGEKFDIQNLLTYVVGQILIVHPFLIWSLFSQWKQFQKMDKVYLKSSLFIFAFFLYSSIKSHVEANWTSQALPTMWFVAAKHISQLKSFIVSMTWVILVTLVGSHWIHPWITSAPEKLNEVHELKEILLHIKDCPTIYADTYQTASLLSFYSGKMVYKLKGVNRFDQFDLISPEADSLSSFCFIGRDITEIPSRFHKKFEIEKKESFQNGKTKFLLRKKQ